MPAEKTTTKKTGLKARLIQELEKKANFQTMASERVEVPLKREKGLLMWVRIDIQADRDENGAVIQWCVVLVDITREKQAWTASATLPRPIVSCRISPPCAKLKKKKNGLKISCTRPKKWKPSAHWPRDVYQFSLSVTRLHPAEDEVNQSMTLHFSLPQSIQEG